MQIIFKPRLLTYEIIIKELKKYIYIYGLINISPLFCTPILLFFSALFLSYSSERKKKNVFYSVAKRERSVFLEQNRLSGKYYLSHLAMLPVRGQKEKERRDEQHRRKSY